MCIGRVSSGNRTLLGIQRRGRVGVVSSSSKLATPSCSSSPRYYWGRERKRDGERERERERDGERERERERERKRDGERERERDGEREREIKPCYVQV